MNLIPGVFDRVTVGVNSWPIRSQLSLLQGHPSQFMLCVAVRYGDTHTWDQWHMKLVSQIDEGSHLCTELGKQVHSR